MVGLRVYFQAKTFGSEPQALLLKGVLLPPHPTPQPPSSCHLFSLAFCFPPLFHLFALYFHQHFGSSCFNEWNKLDFKRPVAECNFFSSPTKTILIHV